MTVRRAAMTIAVIAGCAGCPSRCAGQDRSSDPANELPFGKIDVPVESARVQARTPVAGWALDDRGIREIRVYVDGRFAALGAMKEPRPDVRLALPDYPCGRDRHGWRAAARTPIAARSSEVN